jgi:glycerol-3-phosphate acyltransferase PlsY
VKSFLIIVVAYTLGSIPFGYLIVRARAGADIRQTGSGGTGATNVSRRAGKTAGLLTLLLDATKGVIAVLLARFSLAPDGMLIWPVGLAALAVIVGHIFPVWLGFRGGKGVATGIGVFLVLAPFMIVPAGLVFLITIILTRYVSLASILTVTAITLFVWLQMQFAGPSAGGQVLLFTSAAITTLIVFAHRSNIGRLVRGTESRFR